MPLRANFGLSLNPKQIGLRESVRYLLKLLPRPPLQIVAVIYFFWRKGWAVKQALLENCQ